MSFIRAAGMNVGVASLDVKSVAAYAGPGKMQTTSGFLLDIIPSTIVGAFARGDILSVLFFAILFGFALHLIGEKGKVIHTVIEQFSAVLFRIVGIIMRVAPIGAFGAMAFTIGKYGLGTLLPAWQTDGLLLCHLPDLYLRGAGHRGPPPRFQYLEVSEVHQGRAAPRAGNVVV